MEQFFDFTIWCAKEFTSFLLALPFMRQFGFGSAIIAITIIGMLIVALVGRLRVASLIPDGE
jgi:hypothetical protein